jgi:diaminopimelate epimerase
MKPTQMEFFKMSAAGNDFIVFDNRPGTLKPEGMRTLLAGLCARGLSVGADGIVLLDSATEGDVRAQFFNPDGEPTFCGNGARCAARMAYLKGMAPARMKLQTDRMMHRAEVCGDAVMLEMPDPGGLEENIEVEIDGRAIRGTLIDTGVPHFVVFQPIPREEPIEPLGWALRNHPRFAPAGVNVDFVGTADDGTLTVRTYERGVERETLACGTGCVAVAVAATASGKGRSPLAMRTHSGVTITVEFEGEAAAASGVRITGEARLVYVGQLTEESVRDVTV